MSNDGRVIVFPGGIPLFDQDEIVGAIGISGGEIDQDHTVAEAGVAALGSTAPSWSHTRRIISDPLGLLL